MRLEEEDGSEQPAFCRSSHLQRNLDVFNSCEAIESFRNRRKAFKKNLIVRIHLSNRLKCWKCLKAYHLLGHSFPQWEMRFHFSPWQQPPSAVEWLWLPIFWWTNLPFPRTLGWTLNPALAVKQKHFLGWNSYNIPSVQCAEKGVHAFVFISMHFLLKYNSKSFYLFGTSQNICTTI